MGKRKKSSRKPAPARQKVPLDLTEAIDIYSEWIDAADAAQNNQTPHHRPAPSSSRPVPAPASGEDDSDEE
ncbi:hypothetical protein H0H92_010945 [Tricholoma furcatifolium]|nr:hypothetical protein H0H92_010945 [Tricholoma furcatifolium]